MYAIRSYYEHFESIVGIATGVAHRDLRILSHTPNHLDHLFAAFFGQRRDDDTDYLAIRRRVKPQIRLSYNFV